MMQGTVYIQRFENQSDLDFITSLVQSGVNSLKIEGSFSALRPTHALDKTVRIVARNIALLEEPQQSDYPYGKGDPKAAAAWHVSLLKTQIDALAGTPNSIPVASVWWDSPYNEEGELENPQQLGWYNDFEVERQHLYALKGWHAAIGCFSAEARLDDKLTAFLPAIRAAYANGNLLDLHGYNSAALGTPQTILDPGPTGQDVYHYLFPHRAVYDALKAIGEPCPAFFNGEFGYDQIVYNNDPALDKGQGGFRGIESNEEYAGQLAEAFSFYGMHPADALLVGAAIFIFSDSDQIQDGYNIKWASGRGGTDTGVAYRLLEYFSAHKGDPIAIPSSAAPPVTPPPAPDNGLRVLSHPGGVNVRSTPVYTEGNIIASMPDGTVVHIEGDVIPGPTYGYRKITAYIADKYLVKK